MKVSKIALIILLLSSFSVLSLSCAAKSGSAVPENQIVTVPRGNLTVDITAAGNLALSRTEDLAFDLFYAEGTVEEVLVQEGESVEEGQVLARVDTLEWQDELTNLESQLATKERDLVQAEINLINAGIALQDAEAYYVWPTEVFSAREAVRKVESDVKEAQAMLGGGVVKETYDRQTGKVTVTTEQAITPWDIKVWTDKLADYEETLRAARVKLDNLLVASAGDTKEVTIKRLQLQLTELRLDDAQKAVEDAQKALDEAKSKSPVITALFAGFITKVNVEGGDEVFTGTVAVQLADPNKFEADIMVSEMDIPSVKLEGEARVQVDAMPGLSLPAKVTHISPTATIQSGVVNYKVKVEIQSLEAIMPARPQASGNLSSANISSGAPSGGFRRPFAGDNLTSPDNSTSGAPSRGFRRPFAGDNLTQEQIAQQMPTMVTEGFQLKEGLTVTVSIITQERNDVLLVLNGAITRRGMGSIVQVSKDGVIEERAITTGISNWQYTEVTSGLNEGEQVVIPKSTTTATTAPQQGPSGGFIPGMGRMIR